MPSCCAFGCINSSKKGFKLYRIPSGPKNKTRAKVWLHGISRDKWKPPVDCKLCEVHFTDDQFENRRADKKKLLKWNAVPSIFSHRPNAKLRKPSKYVLRDQNACPVLLEAVASSDKTPPEFDDTQDNCDDLQDCNAPDGYSPVGHLMLEVAQSCETQNDPQTQKNSVPNCKEFKTCLRMVILSQFFKSPTNGNYFIDDMEEFGSFLAELQHDMHKDNSDAVNIAESEHEEGISFDIDLDRDEIEVFGCEFITPDVYLTPTEMQSLHYLSGCIARKIMRRYKLCSVCIETLVLKGDSVVSAEIQMYTKLKNFKENQNLVFVPENVFSFLLAIEKLFRTVKDEILYGGVDLRSISSKFENSVKVQLQKLPICCLLAKKLMNVFVVHRIHFLIKIVSDGIKKNGIKSAVVKALECV